MSVRNIVTRAAVCGATLLVVTGCGGDPREEAAEPAPAPSTAASPAEEPEESAPVATGPVLRMPSAEVTMPAGWRRFDQLIPATDSARVPRGIGVITLSEVDSFDDSTNDELARITMESAARAGQVRQLDDVEVDGVAMYRIVSRDRAASYQSYTLEELGTVYQDQVVKLTLDLDATAPPAEREAIRDQVLASFRWR